MKIKSIGIAIITVALAISCEKDNNNGIKQTSMNDSVSMGANYSYDIFYHLETGASYEALPNNWDIGFRTYYMSSSIFINSGKGIKLYEYSKDTADWYTSIDTSGYRSLPLLNNSLENWETGAFSANSTGMYNFGWGEYNPDTHDLLGAATYLIVLQDGTVKKIFIRMKHSVANIYYFAFADPDGSDPHIITLDCNEYTDKEFIYYSLAENHVVDREPPKENWDLLFTRYYDPSAFYTVTGVLVKPGVKTGEVLGVSPESADTTMTTFSDAPATIGYDWKTFNMDTYMYTVADDRTYFIKISENSVYKLYFTGFDGGSTGIARFTTEKIR